MLKKILVLTIIALLCSPMVYANGEIEDSENGVAEDNSTNTRIDIEANVEGYLDANVSFNADEGNVSVNYNGENLLEKITDQQNTMEIMLLNIQHQRETQKIYEKLLKIIEEKEEYSVNSDNQLYARDNALAQYIGVTESSDGLRVLIVNGNTTLIQEIEALWAELEDTKEVCYTVPEMQKEISLLKSENEELGAELRRLESSNRLDVMKMEAELRHVKNSLEDNEARYDFIVKDIVSALVIFLVSIPLFKYKLMI